MCVSVVPPCHGLHCCSNKGHRLSYCLPYWHTQLAAHGLLPSLSDGNTCTAGLSNDMQCMWSCSARMLCLIRLPPPPTLHHRVRLCEGGMGAQAGGAEWGGGVRNTNPRVFGTQVCYGTCTCMASLWCHLGVQCEVRSKHSRKWMCS